MNSLTPRILALPADVRAALARVDGPGWRVYKDHKGRTPAPYGCGTVRETCDWPEHAWWPGNPAASVAAVLGISIWHAHQRIALDGSAGGDHAAALAIIEAHVASRGTP